MRTNNDSFFERRKTRTKVRVYMCLAAMLLGSCSTSVGSYAKDRVRDTADVFSVNFIYPAFGFKMDISGSSFGFHYTSYYENNKAGSFGLRGGEFNTNAPTTDYVAGIGAGTFINGFPRSKEGKIEEWYDPSNDDPSFYRGKRFKTGWKFPGYLYGRIGFTISCLIGIQVHYNLGEDLDLLLGWFGIDIFDDDMYAGLEKDEKRKQSAELNERNNYSTKVNYETVLQSAQNNFDSKNYKKAAELASYVYINGNNSETKRQAKLLARKAILRHSFESAAQQTSIEE